jgi:hypothetical protein
VVSSPPVTTVVEKHICGAVIYPLETAPRKDNLAGPETRGVGRPPSRCEVGTFAAQLGLESTGVVMLVMNQRRMDRLAPDKFTTGADASRLSDQ